MSMINAGAAAITVSLSDQESLGGGARSIFRLDDPLIVTAADVDPFPEFELWAHKVPFMSPELTARIVVRLKRWAERSANGKGCIEWTGAKRGPGYGKINYWLWGRHDQEYVHRLSYFLKTGKEIPFWMEVAHSCDNPPCFNPEHVDAQRRRDNRVKSALNTHAKKAAAAARMAA